MILTIVWQAVLIAAALHVLFVLPTWLLKREAAPYFEFLRPILTSKAWWKGTDYIWLLLAIAGAQSFHDNQTVEHAKEQALAVRKQAYDLIFSQTPSDWIVEQNIQILRMKLTLPNPRHLSNAEHLSLLMDTTCGQNTGNELVICSITGQDLLSEIRTNLAGDTLDVPAMKRTLSHMATFEVHVQKNTTPKKDPFIIHPDKMDKPDFQGYGFWPFADFKDIKPALKKLAALLDPIVNEYARHMDNIKEAKEGFFIRFRDTWPFFLAFTIAIRLTKTTAEIVLDTTKPQVQKSAAAA